MRLIDSVIENSFKKTDEGRDLGYWRKEELYLMTMKRRNY